MLTPADLGDFQDIHDLWNDPVTLAYLGKPSTMEEAWVRLLKYVGHWSLFGFGFWMLREAGTGRFVGEAGLAYHKRGLGADPEAGWALAGPMQGKGFAREALLAIVAWADVHLKADRTICLIDPANLASVRLAHSIGFQSAGEADLDGRSVILLERFANRGD
jgi:RimJ/RimL family protein N-acetyltransferase